MCSKSLSLGRVAVISARVFIWDFSEHHREVTGQLFFVKKGHALTADNESSEANATRILFYFSLKSRDTEWGEFLRSSKYSWKIVLGDMESNPKINVCHIGVFVNYCIRSSYILSAAADFGHSPRGSSSRSKCSILKFEYHVCTSLWDGALLPVVSWTSLKPPEAPKSGRR